MQMLTSHSSSDNSYKIRSFGNKDYTDQLIDPFIEMMWFQYSLGNQMLYINRSELSVDTLLASIMKYDPPNKSQWLETNSFWESESMILVGSDLTQAVVISAPRVVPYLRYVEGSKNLSVSPENYYTYKVSKFNNIEAIVFNELDNVKCFKAILSKRDLEVRDKIYDIELEMFEQYPDQKYYFIVDYITKSNELDSLVKNKKVLYLKPSIHAI